MDELPGGFASVGQSDAAQPRCCFVALMSLNAFIVFQTSVFNSSDIWGNRQQTGNTSAKCHLETWEQEGRIGETLSAALICHSSFMSQMLL